MSNTPRGIDVRKRRGPYKKYLDHNKSIMQNDDEIPRTTAFDKKRRFSQASHTYQEVDGAAVQKDIVHTTNYSSCYIENPTNHDFDYQAENIVHVADSGSYIYDSADTEIEHKEAEETTDQDQLHDNQAENITDQESVHDQTDNTTDDESYIVGHNFRHSSFINQRLNAEFRSRDLEGVETYSAFENQCPCASSEMQDTITDDDPDIPQYGNPDVNDDDPADDLQNGGPADDIQDEYFSEHLCQCTPTSRGEAIMAVLALAVRHSFTWVAIVDMLETINALFGNDVVPATKYKLFKYFAIQSDYFRYHIICPKCDSLLGKQSQLSEKETKLCKCGHEVKVADMESFFLSAGFDKQLRTVLQTPEVSRNLNYRDTRHIPTEGDLTDIYDGKIYKFLSTEGQPLSCVFNLSYTL